jgi:AraC-like DNA-binding protein
MLIPETELSCGIFDSTALHKNVVHTQPRTVVGYELEIFHTDMGKSYMNETGHDVRRGMILCARPGAIRRSDLPVRCSFIRISAPAAEREGVAELLSSFLPYTYTESAEETDEMIALFSKLAKRLFEAPSSDMIAGIRANALFLDILYRLHRIFTKSAEPLLSKPAGDVLYAAREYIDEHYRENCSLRDISEAVSLSPNYLHTVFRQAFGETPYAYVTRKRIEKAKLLIMAGQLSMLRIANETGFCSQSHFNKVFKAQTGITPKQFRDSFLDEY